MGAKAKGISLVLLSLLSLAQMPQQRVPLTDFCGIVLDRFAHPACFETQPDEQDADETPEQEREVMDAHAGCPSRCSRAILPKQCRQVTCAGSTVTCGF